jgi:hypothetical protein
MQKANRSGALHSNRTGEYVLVGTLPNSTNPTHTQRLDMPTTLTGYRVDRFCTVTPIWEEVDHG